MPNWNGGSIILSYSSVIYYSVTKRLHTLIVCSFTKLDGELSISFTCLYFLEAADFVLVSDLDDVLIPKLGTNFLEEFQALLRIYPAAAGFQFIFCLYKNNFISFFRRYNRYNTELITSKPDSTNL